MSDARSPPLNSRAPRSGTVLKAHAPSTFPPGNAVMEPLSASNDPGARQLSDDTPPRWHRARAESFPPCPQARYQKIRVALVDVLCGPETFYFPQPIELTRRAARHGKINEITLTLALLSKHCSTRAAQTTSPCV